MGMFDQLRIRRAMPDGFQSDDWYQSKSMECDLADFEIDGEDQLWEVGRCEIPYPEGKKQSHYSGEIVFYTVIRQENKPNLWKQYRAILENGKLTNVAVSESR